LKKRQKNDTIKHGTFVKEVTKLKVAICDDEKPWANEINSLLNEYSQTRRIDVFSFYYDSGTSLIESEKNFDIIFMDYQMNGLNGIETARKINSLNPDGIIIFISAYTNVALDAFEVKAYRFIAKPIDKDKLFKAIDDYRTDMNSDNFLIFKTHDGTIRIRTSEIVYIEAFGSHSIIHTGKNDTEIIKNLKSIQDNLPSDKFFRCHKAFITSFSHIQAHDNTTIKFDNGSKIFISRNYLSKFKKSFVNYIFRYNTSGGQQN